jgi:hypothetical protein
MYLKTALGRCIQNIPNFGGFVKRIGDIFGSSYAMALADIAYKTKARRSGPDASRE